MSPPLRPRLIRQRAGLPFALVGVLGFCLALVLSLQAW